MSVCLIRSGPIDILKMLALSMLCRSIRRGTRSAARRYGSVTRAAREVERRTGRPWHIAHNIMVAGPTMGQCRGVHGLNLVSDIAHGLNCTPRFEYVPIAEKGPRP